ncbi:MAG: hypothetical protein N2049_00155 [Anaerolineales bacterium]|nr:hypothetical protein [Anaerolineales bacterium]MCX7607619.1 hypothetical protein [Anaerolineales bacterium]MDW8226858.1 hypothetical protein [Anaerolineales bacterium]
MLILVFAFVAATLVVGLIGSIPIQVRWLLILVIFVAFLAALGKHVTGERNEKNKLVGGRWVGILIDSRNKLSLSRLQITLWTLLALSAFSVIALDRTIPLLTGEVKWASDTAFDPLHIKFPEELLIAMGISTASLAGATYIKSAKAETQSSRKMQLLMEQIAAATKRRDTLQRAVEEAKQRLNDLMAELSRLRNKPETDPDHPATLLRIDRINKELLPTEKLEFERAEAALQEVLKELDSLNKAREGALGDVHTNDSIDQADWSDIFRGELVSNYRVVDPAKVQMFFFTVLLVFIYGTLIWGMLGAEAHWRLAASVELPPFSDSLVALLGISHAGYLIVKQTSN